MTFQCREISLYFFSASRVSSNADDNDACTLTNRQCQPDCNEYWTMRTFLIVHVLVVRTKKNGKPQLAEFDADAV
jgi:hypothetical protein